MAESFIEVANWLDKRAEIQEIKNPCKDCPPHRICKTPYCKSLETPLTVEYVGKKN